MPPPVVSLSQINKRKRNFVPKVAVRPPVQPNRPPSSRQTTVAPPELVANTSLDAGSVFETAQSPDGLSPLASQRVLPVTENVTTPSLPPILTAGVTTRPPLSTISIEIPPIVHRPPASPIRVLPTPISIPSRVSRASSSVHAVSPAASPKLTANSLPVVKPRHDFPQTSVRPAPPPSPRRRPVNNADHIAPVSIDPSVSSTGMSQPANVASRPRSQSLEHRHGGTVALHNGTAHRPLFIEPEGNEAANDNIDLTSNKQNATPLAEHGPLTHKDATRGTASENDNAVPSTQKHKRKRRRRVRRVKSSGSITGEDASVDHSSPPPRSPGNQSRRRSQRRNLGGAAESGAKTGAEDDAGEDDRSPVRKRRRSQGITSTRSTSGKARKIRKKRKTAEQIAQEDAEAEGKEHDPTLTTMSALVEDLPVGRSTSTRQHIQERIRENRARDRARREELRVADRNVTLGKPRDETREDASRQTHPRATLEGTTNTGVDESQHKDSNLFTEGSGDDSGNDFEGEGDDFLADIPTSSHVAQISINDEGNIMADELQMEIDRPDTLHLDNYERVFEREADRFVNSLSHSKRHKGSARWSEAETAIFYHNLAMYGTDFESIARVMPGRTRHEIKNKFNAEDKRNSQLINQYLFQPKPIDLDEAGRLTGKDLSGPPPEVGGPDSGGAELTRQEDKRTEEPAVSLTNANESETIVISGEGAQEQTPGEISAEPEWSLASAPLENDESWSPSPSPEGLFRS